MCVCELDLLHHSWQQEQRNDHHNDSERQKKVQKTKNGGLGSKTSVISAKYGNEAYFLKKRLTLFQYDEHSFLDYSEILF